MCVIFFSCSRLTEFAHNNSFCPFALRTRIFVVVLLRFEIFIFIQKILNANANVVVCSPMNKKSVKQQGKKKTYQGTQLEYCEIVDSHRVESFVCVIFYCKGHCAARA